MDNLNVLLYNIPEYELARLQSIQNCAAKTITCKRKFDHVTPILKELHWLPVRERIQFKILLITYKALHGLAPQYITDLLGYNTSPYNTRAADDPLRLHIPGTKHQTFADRSFSVAAPKLWNDVPLHIRQSKSIECFKSGLKTHLFVNAKMFKNYF